jgi:hypothetical protein
MHLLEGLGDPSLKEGISPKTLRLSVKYVNALIEEGSF